jgi:hypothetical protein
MKADKYLAIGIIYIIIALIYIYKAFYYGRSYTKADAKSKEKYFFGLMTNSISVPLYLAVAVLYILEFTSEKGGQIH